MTRASFEAFRQTVTVAWPKEQNADARKHLINVAKAGHAKIMGAAAARGGRPTFTAFANEPGRPVEAVVLPGPIVYKYGYIREVIVAALEELRRASPVTSGRYRDSHVLFVNGIAVTTIPETLKSTDDIMISNPVPYARRLEIGKTEQGRDFLVQVPNRIYERAAARLSRKYGKVARIGFEYADLPSAYKTNAALPARYATTANRGGGARVKVLRKRRQVRGTPVRAPAIVIGMLV